jgi:general secretion pathway protein B
MSYILEALKKAEQQRELGRVPGIETEHEQARTRAASRWPWLITAVVAINALVLLLSLPPERFREMPAEVDGRQQASPDDSVESPRTSPATEPEVDQETTTEGATPPDSHMTEELTAVDRRSESSPAVSEHQGQFPSVAEAARPAAAAAVSYTADTGEEPELPVWPRIPDYLLGELSGGLSLDVHVYAERPPERFVLINLQKYREAETLQEGPRVDEITPDGVILSYQGTRFRVQAQ